jgi:carbon storage regulator
VSECKLNGATFRAEFARILERHTRLGGWRTLKVAAAISQAVESTKEGRFMLVLSRKIGEQIIMPGQEVVVTVVAIHGNRVRIGITAPSDVAVYREELHRAAVNETECAAGACAGHGS